MSSSIERLGLNASDSSHGRVQLHLLAVGAAQVGAKADKLDGDKAKPKAARHADGVTRYTSSAKRG